MNKSELIKKAVMSALGTLVYVAALAWLIGHTEHGFGVEPGWFVGVFVFLLFIISACVTGSLVLLRPVMLYVDGRKKEGLTLFIYTLVCLVVLAGLVAIVLIDQSNQIASNIK